MALADDDGWRGPPDVEAAVEAVEIAFGWWVEIAAPFLKNHPKMQIWPQSANQKRFSPFRLNEAD